MNWLSFKDELWLQRCHPKSYPVKSLALTVFSISNEKKWLSRLSSDMSEEKLY